MLAALAVNRAELALIPDREMPMAFMGTHSPERIMMRAHA